MYMKHNLETTIIINEIKLKETKTGKQEYLQPIVEIYNNSMTYERISNVRDYIWYYKKERN